MNRNIARSRKQRKVNFAELIIAALEERNMTAFALAKKCGIHNTNIYNWINGKHAPSYDQLCKLAEGLNLHLEYFHAED